nr:VOC family protein [Kibdelosporangium sp. MJ126-NF4]CEL21722.1 PhnB protein; putative DNA binding 3-demethylubiquinone-9 3-methyltransferase domain protein [Kibdelosporangium sp. MJ126-NF4]CTQ92503.1 PhnB protein; putative DNA binding 3-demethylubiquinone-9 3-methyltransferase domain protein [Kibdelosporangium sp. MJ126-NF4]
MESRLNPYISYNGNARQAMEFYQKVFDGKLKIGTVADFGSPDSPDADKVMHAQLDTPDGFTLMAWDVLAGVPYHPGNNVAVYLGGEGGGLRGYFEKLSAGGTVTMRLEKQSWGDEAGALVDRFGITWMVNITHQQT